MVCTSESFNVLADVDIRQLGVVYTRILIFSIFTTIGALETNKVQFTTFFLIDFLFIDLSLCSFGIMELDIHTLEAYSEMAIGILSLYGAGASVLNKHFVFTFLPIGKPFSIITNGHTN